jgi:predicted ATPase
LAIGKSATMGARAWELRAATDLAALWLDDGRLREARILLQPIFERFDEGSDTTDVRAARVLLQGLL